MMEKQQNKDLEYCLNSQLIADDGSFQCPKCGRKISPEDETNENYEIIETKVQKGDLVELVIRCSKCGSTLKLTGFQ
jgi:predicted RNA-binding Zn-ribbon protein involved in translation (DUF1610 family)